MNITTPSHVSPPPHPAPRTTPHKTLLTLILLAFALLAIAYSIVTPLFETPDEDHHFFYVRRLADGGGLPIIDLAHPGPWGQEAGQPPLYYALGALLIRPLGVQDDASLIPNPHANLGNPLQPGNKNRWVHTPAENWPWRGWALAAHLLRFFSILLGLGTIYLTYRLAAHMFLARAGGASEQTKERTNGRAQEAGILALAAAALAAFLPQFIFSSASINNDNLVIFLATLALFLLARSDANDNWFGVLLLGLAMGLAALAKVSGLLLLPLATVVFLWRAWRTRCWGRMLAHLAIVALLVLAIAGWWYVRNWRLYGDPTALRPMIAIVGPRTQPLTWQILPSEFQGLRISLFGLFGWFNLPLPGWVYRLWDGFLLLAGAGLLLALWRRRSDKRSDAPSLLLALWLLLVLVSLLRLTSLTLGSQGRLLLPALAAVAILLISGWSQWLSPRRRSGQIWLALPAVAAFLAAIFSLILIIAPAYRRPPILSPAALPASARIQPLTIADRIQLLGLVVEPTVPSPGSGLSLRPGQSFDLTLYWQATQPVPFAASLALRLFGPGDKPYAQWDTYPGWGNFPTTLWPTGAIIADHYRLQAPWDAPAPTLLKLDLSLYDYASKTSYPSHLPSGLPPPLGLATLRLLPAASSTPPIPTSAATPTAFDFDDRVQLLGYSLPAPSSNSRQVFHPGDTLDLDLFWQASAPVGEDLQVFVHLLDDNGQRLAGYDAAPRAGWWPTSAWEPGQVVEDHYPLPLPSDLKPGRYTLAAGLYRLATLERLPVSGPPGSTRDRAALLTTIEVAP